MLFASFGTQWFSPVKYRNLLGVPKHRDVGTVHPRMSRRRRVA